MSEYNVIFPSSCGSCVSELDSALRAERDLFKTEIHIRLELVKGKTVTTIGTFPTTINIAKMIRSMKKNFNCGGHIADNRVVVLQGDHRQECKQILSPLIDNIIVHGY